MIRGHDADIARQSVLLGGVPAEIGDAILAQSVNRNFARGETIFLHGDPALHVFIVLEGWVKLFRITQAGAEAVVAVFTRGQSFGEAVAFRDAEYPVNAEAVTDCRLMQVDAPALLGRMRANPELFTAILASTFRHLQALVGQVEQLKAQTGAQRIAEFLLELCRAEAGACSVTLPYDKTLIAGRLGMKPESLSRGFARLREAGVTVTQNQAEIADIEALRDFVEQDRADFWRKAQ